MPIPDFTSNAEVTWWQGGWTFLWQQKMHCKQACGCRPTRALGENKLPGQAGLKKRPQTWDKYACKSTKTQSPKFPDYNSQKSGGCTSNPSIPAQTDDFWESQIKHLSNSVRECLTHRTRDIPAFNFQSRPFLFTENRAFFSVQLKKHWSNDANSLNRQQKFIIAAGEQDFVHWDPYVQRCI